ncbi:hypothetical protein TWF694_002953 [Orbilia ellipsospora]|uniref:Uncharacterized protein n=1 Tax=Orbilia ellipsospora TaxID=2528407 RepID=A0AAV9X0B7_9PEZI
MVIIKGCLNRASDFSRPSITEAGVTLAELIKKKSSIGQIISNEVFTWTDYRLKLEENAHLHNRLKQRQTGSFNPSNLLNASTTREILHSLIDLMSFLPETVSSKFADTLERILTVRGFLTNGGYNMVGSVFTGMTWLSESAQADLFRRMCLANPNENFRRDLDEDLRNNLPSDSAECERWTTISLKSQEYIIEGIKQRLASIVCELKPLRYRPPLYSEILGYKRKVSEHSPDIEESTSTQLLLYAVFICDPAQPETLMFQFLQAIQPEPTWGQEAVKIIIPTASWIWGLGAGKPKCLATNPRTRQPWEAVMALLMSL